MTRPEPDVCGVDVRGLEICDEGNRARRGVTRESGPPGRGFREPRAGEIRPNGCKKVLSVVDARCPVVFEQRDGGDECRGRLLSPFIASAEKRPPTVLMRDRQAAPVSRIGIERKAPKQFDRLVVRPESRCELLCASTPDKCVGAIQPTGREPVPEAWVVQRKSTTKIERAVEIPQRLRDRAGPRVCKKRDDA